MYLFLQQRNVVNPKLTFSEICSLNTDSILCWETVVPGNKHKKVTARRVRSTSYTCTDVETNENP
jgi:hypothetical protein